MIDPVTLRPLIGQQDDQPMPLVAHLAELRTRLIQSLLILALGSAIAFHYSGAFLSWLARPVGQLVFIAPTEAFYTRLQVAVFGGFVMTLPLLLHQAWLFTARAIDARWRLLLLRLLPLSYGMFLLGACLCLFAVVPAAMRFLLAYGSEGVRPMLTLGAYLDFVSGLTLAFGAVFQMPLILYALNRTGVLALSTLAGLRPHAWFACFVGAAFLTPGPDIVTQLSLAVPAVILFELTLLAMRR
jgi:sec-independent protein translocase protein TatC